MRVRDGPSDSVVPSMNAEDGTVDTDQSVNIPFLRADNQLPTFESSSTSSLPLLSGVDLLYQFHLYIRTLERSHESCKMEKFALISQLGVEKENALKLASKVSFLQKRILMLEAALTGKSPTHELLLSSASLPYQADKFSELLLSIFVDPTMSQSAVILKMLILLLIKMHSSSKSGEPI